METRSQDLLDAASCRVSVEQIRDLWKIQSNRLAVGYLLAEKDKDRDEKIMGLVWCCGPAVNRLFLQNQEDEIKYADDFKSARIGRNGRRSENLLFLWESVIKILAPHEGKSRREILLAALAGEFRYIPRAVRCDMLNQITSQRRRRLRVLDAGHNIYSDRDEDAANSDNPHDRLPSDKDI
jgi:hypothetical protein